MESPIESAFTKAPVEIWAEIFDYLLNAGNSFNPNPFYPGCNLHTALMEWYDASVLRSVERQRGILRLVCRAWMELADRNQNRFYEANERHGSPLKPSKMRSAVRMHVQVSQNPCECIGPCLCTNFNYKHRRIGHDNLLQNYRHLHQFLLEMPSGSQLPMKILIFSRVVWHELSELLGKELGFHSLSSVGALGIASYAKVGLVPAVFPKLTFLSINLHPREEYPTHQLDFPELIVFVMIFSRHHVLEQIGRWNFPKLQHLSIKGRSFRETAGPLPTLLEKSGSLLVSLRLNFSVHEVILPSVVWTYLPRLQYLGLSSFGNSGIPTPPSKHPLHTLAMLEVPSELSPRNMLQYILPTWSNIATVADIHRWEDIPIIFYDRFPDIHHPFQHDHAWPRCQLCIRATEYLCSSLNLRYEDRYGTTLEEFTNTLVITISQMYGLDDFLDYDEAYDS